jgi:hypothetical protein
MHGMVSKIHQGVHILHRDQIDTTAIAAITAIRAAHGNILLTPKANSAVTAITRLYTNFRFVNKSHNLHATLNTNR